MTGTWCGIIVKKERINFLASCSECFGIGCVWPEHVHIYMQVGFQGSHGHEFCLKCGDIILSRSFRRRHRLLCAKPHRGLANLMYPPVASEYEHAHIYQEIGVGHSPYRWMIQSEIRHGTQYKARLLTTPYR